MILRHRFRRSSGLLLVSVLAAIITAAFFSFVLAHPNDYFFLVGGDALQSYYATAYYTLYDKGIHFSGMNYPYGEHFNYPNLQPLIALLMNWAQRLGLPTAEYTIGITNLIALLGLAATPPAVYLVLRRSALPTWYAVATALFIGFLAPQVDRLGGHMSLSYACFVPLLWYFIIRMQEAPQQRRWYVWFAVSSMLMGLVQVYFLACGCFFLLAHVLVLAWQQRRQRPWPWLLRMTLTAVVPLVLFRGWLWATDLITDRPPNPYGLLVYTATPSSVFAPNYGSFHDKLQKVLPLEGSNPEGWAYIGMVCTLTLLVTLVAWLLYLPRRRKPARHQYATVPAHLRTGLWAAGLLLVFSFGVPFKLPGLGWTVDYAGFVKQFRSLGRFAWPFYYVAGAYTAYYLYRGWRYLRWHRATGVALAWLPLLLLAWAAEAWINLDVKRDSVALGSGAATYFDPRTSITQQLSWARRQPSDFQAIMSLPFFNMGSDKTVMTGSEASFFQSYQASFATGLPLLGSYMPRASIEQVLKHAQLLAGPMLEKTIIRDLPNDKPLLLLVTPDYLTLAEQRLVSLGRLLVSTPQATLYELPLSALGATTIAQEHAKAVSLWSTLPARPGGLRCTSSKGVYYQPFNDQPDRRGRLGDGAFTEPDYKFSSLYDGPVPAPADTGRYEVSAWVSGRTAYGYGNMQVKQYAAGQMVDHQVFDPRTSGEVDGDWLRVAVPVSIRPGVDRLEVLYDNQDLLLDDLLIRPADTDVYWQDAAHRFVLNGYRLAPAAK